MTNGSGRSRRSQISAIARASNWPKIGWSSGAVRKSPSRPGSGGRGPVVAAGRVVQGEVHEAREGHRTVGGDLGADPRGEVGVLTDIGEVGRRFAAEAGAQGSHGRQC